MNRRSLSVLIVLNAVLLAAIALTLGPVPKADAQIGGGGDYLMIAGSTPQAQQQVVYIMDLRNSRVAGLTVNSANNKVEIIGGRSIGKDLKDGGGGGR